MLLLLGLVHVTVYLDTAAIAHLRKVTEVFYHVILRMQVVMQRAGLGNEQEALQRLQAVQALLPGIQWGTAGGVRATDLAVMVQDLQGMANKLVTLTEALPGVNVAALMSSREGAGMLVNETAEQLRHKADQVGEEG